MHAVHRSGMAVAVDGLPEPEPLGRTMRADTSEDRPMHTGTSPSPTVGDPAPPLELDTIDGSAIRLADHDGAALVSFLRHAG